MGNKEYCINEGCGMQFFHCDCGLKGKQFNSNLKMEKIDTPKEKAMELFNNVFPNSNPKNDAKYKDKLNQKLNAIDNCKITVNEILLVLDSGSLYMEQAKEGITNNEFWIEVLSELDLIQKEIIVK